MKQVFQALAVSLLALASAAILRPAPAAAEAFAAPHVPEAAPTVVPVWDAEAAAQWFVPSVEEQLALNMGARAALRTADAEYELALRDAGFEVDGCTLPAELPTLIKAGAEVAVAMARGQANIQPTIVAKPSTPIISSVCADGCQLANDTGGDDAGWFDALGPNDLLTQPHGRQRDFVLDAFSMHRRTLAPDPHPPRIA